MTCAHAGISKAELSRRLGYKVPQLFQRYYETGIFTQVEDKVRRVFCNRHDPVCNYCLSFLVIHVIMTLFMAGNGRMVIDAVIA